MTVAKEKSQHPMDSPALHFSPKGTEPPIVVNTATREELMHDLRHRILNNVGFTVATLNLDHAVKIRRDPDFLNAYARHSHVVADGNPIVWMARLSGDPIELVPGSELIEPVAALAAELSTPIGLFGASESVLEKATEHLVSKIPDVQVSSRVAPPRGFDPLSTGAADFLQQLSQSPARIWFLALGAPKQEMFAARAASMLPDRGFLSIGAGLDFLAGSQKRAPSWVRKLQLEWFWRAVQSPMRLGVRYLRCIAILPALTFSALGHRMRRDKISTLQ